MLSGFRIFQCSALNGTFRAVGSNALQLIMGKGYKSAMSTMYLFSFQLTRFARMGVCVCVIIAAWARAHVEVVRLRARI